MANGCVRGRREFCTLLHQQLVLHNITHHFSHNSLARTRHLALFNLKEAKKCKLTMCQVRWQYLTSSTYLPSNPDECHSYIPYCSYFLISVWTSETLVTFLCKSKSAFEREWEKEKEGERGRGGRDGRDGQGWIGGEGQIKFFMETEIFWGGRYKLSLVTQQ